MSETKERETVPCAYCPWDCAYKGEIKGNISGGYFIRCNSNSSDCYHMTDVFDTKDEAIDAWTEEMLGMWNRRAAPTEEWVNDEMPEANGLYVCRDKQGRFQVVEKRGRCFYRQNGFVEECGSFVQQHKPLSWLRIPALPGEGKNDE